MDWLTLFKFAGIIVAGVLGILGTLTETRDKTTKRLTKWGYCAVWLTIAALAVALGAQWKEYSKQQQEEIDSRIRTEKLLSKLDEQGMKSSQILTNLAKTQLDAVEQIRLESLAVSALDKQMQLSHESLVYLEKSATQIGMVKLVARISFHADNPIFSELASNYEKLPEIERLLVRSEEIRTDSSAAICQIINAADIAGSFVSSNHLTFLPDLDKLSPALASALKDPGIGITILTTDRGSLGRYEFSIDSRPIFSSHALKPIAKPFIIQGPHKDDLSLVYHLAFNSKDCFQLNDPTSLLDLARKAGVLVITNRDLSQIKGIACTGLLLDFGFKALEFNQFSRITRPQTSREREANQRTMWIWESCIYDNIGVTDDYNVFQFPDESTILLRDSEYEYPKKSNWYFDLKNPRK